MVLYVFILLALVVPVGGYLLHGGGGSRAWGLVAAGEEVSGGGAYRRTRSTLWKRGSAPVAVRVAALSSFFLGQMIVPGVLAALAGAFFTFAMVMDGKVMPVLLVLTLSSPTGIMVAAHLLSAGSAMLDRTTDAAFKARRAARWAIGHNVVLLASLGLAAALSRDGDQPWVALGPAIYACVSLAQALLVRGAAGAIDAYAMRQHEAPAPAEAELALLETSGSFATPFRAADRSL